VRDARRGRERVLRLARAADQAPGFKQAHGQAGAGEQGGGDEAVVASTDDRNVGGGS